MEITIESTEKIVDLNGVASRVWEGKTKSGIPVHCFVTRISPQQNKDIKEFEKELVETKAPSAAVAAYPMRLVL